MQQLSSEELQNRRHSLAHLLAAAVMQLWPDAKRTIGPAIDNGFYFDFEFSKPVTEDDLPAIEAKMRETLPSWDGFERFALDAEAAKKEYPGNEYKQELIDEFTKDGQKVTFYKSGDYWDLCKGGHAGSMKDIDPQSFKLDKVAGAYWRGNEKNKMLTRIYGLAFANQADLDAYLAAREDAKQRDHRKLGQELDLFTFSDLVGAGLPLYTPRGTVLIEELKQALKEISRKYDMLQVSIPHLAKIELYQTSGHAQKFADELFTVQSHYDQEFVLKPVNCPHHTQIYASRPRSYRDLPLRYIEQTMQYRDEKPGQIGGLQRTRGFTVDDGHTFCRVDQIEQEASSLVEVVKDFYSGLGLWGNHWVSLSVRDPKTPERYIGEPADWDKAEAMLADVASKYGLEAKRMEGEAALYGPKIDFMFKDSLGRETQLATIQLDFAMPKRFGLTYTDQKGEAQPPVMIHRAILGSFERFIMLLIEHFAGKFPVWLSPEQIRLITVNQEEKTLALAKEIEQKAKELGLRIASDNTNETVGKKIRAAELMKVPYVVVVGDKEAESGKLTPRVRKDIEVQSEHAAIEIEHFLQSVHNEAKSRANKSSL